MSKQRFPSDPVAETPAETPAELEARREMSNSIYERDMAFFKALDEGRRCNNRQWIGHEF